MTGFDLPFFGDNGFTRRICPSCGAHYWSQDPHSPNCGDAPCQEYTFLRTPFTSRPYSMDEMREAFLGYFELNGHTRLARYPVAARWRGDIYLTIASIADFQPHVTSGWVNPPANPLVISQPCIRLNDLDSVGRTGRHLSEFEMLGHHAFNTPGQHIYWKDETVRYCHGFLETIGMWGENYKESTWVGGGNAGACLEVVKGGLEVATLVFMDLKEDPAGTVRVKDRMYSPNPLQIVDTGYGLERFVWASRAQPTIYDAIYPDQIAAVMDHASGVREVDPELLAAHATLMGLMDMEVVGLRGIRKKLVTFLNQRGHRITLPEVETLLIPMEKVYTIVDHTRSLAFMLTDDIVPSANKAGYLARLVIRRTLRLMEDLELALSLGDVVDLHLRAMAGSFPEVVGKRDTIMEVLALETERYHETIRRGGKHVLRIVKDLKDRGLEEFPVDTLLDLYDTHGLHPTIVRTISEDAGLSIDIPDEFNTLIAERHTPAVKEAEGERAYGLPATHPLYYHDESLFEATATVTGVHGNDIILDRTIFYPEGGGQPADTGVIMYGEHILRVTDVRKYGGVIVHTVLPPDPDPAVGDPGAAPAGSVEPSLSSPRATPPSPTHQDRPVQAPPPPATPSILPGHPAPPLPPVGESVSLMIDGDRRQAHRRHHSATHIILESARRVLGSHVWQTGSSFTDTMAHYDITHFRRVTREEMRRMEFEANRIVLEGHPVTKEFLPRDEAEKRYGFRLYQGGAPAVNTIRVVRTGTMERMVDAEACGGTHVNDTRECGMIKILRVTSVQDGVERIEYTAGMATVNAVQRMEDHLDEAADALNVARSHLPGTVSRFFREWKERGKEVQDLRERLAAASVRSLLQDAESVGGVRLISGVLDFDMEGLQTMVGRLLDTRDERERHGGHGEQDRPDEHATHDRPDEYATHDRRDEHATHDRPDEHAPHDIPRLIILGGREGSVLVACGPVGVELDCGKFIRTEGAEIGGKGGGRPTLGQGRFPDAAHAVAFLGERAKLRLG